MKHVMLTGAAALAMTFGAVGAHAGGIGGGPVQPVCYNDDGDEIDCPSQAPGDGGAPSGPGDTGAGTGTGGSGGAGGGTPSPSATITFNALGHVPLSTYTEGDYVVKLVTGTITGGFGAYGTVGLDTTAPATTAYVPGSPTPQFSLERSDGGFFTVDSFFNVLLSDNGTNTTTLQGYVDGVLGGTSSVSSSFQGFGYPQASGLAGAYDKVLFTLASSDDSSGMSFDNLAVTAAAAPAAVPETASWAMMVLGFGAIGVAARGKRSAIRFA